MTASAEDVGNMDELQVQLLPLETRLPPFPLRQYGGCWLPEMILRGVPAVHARFDPRPSDVFLCSFPKSGTTWLKALAFATLNRAELPPRGSDHPLRRRNPHDCVKFFEQAFALSADDDGGDVDLFAHLPSPRVLATHLPYGLLPGRITADDSGCRMVYICRDPKDAFVSAWMFTKKWIEAHEAGANAGNPLPWPLPPITFEEAFELFCNGRCVAGPQWQHVVGYWEESRRRPDRVLFLRYEEMLRDPVGNVKKLAEFLGCGLSGEEESAGVGQDIVDLCSLDNLKKLEVNKNGSQVMIKNEAFCRKGVDLCSLDNLKKLEVNKNGTEVMIKNEAFFRKGVAGDWSNHMTPAMAARLDKIVEDAVQESGFTFVVANE